MRILLINHYAGSPSLGMEYRPYYLAREWIEMGHEVFVLSAGYSHVRSVQPGLAYDFQEETIDGIHYIWIKTPTYHDNNHRRILNILFFISKMAWKAKWLARSIKPDVVIASSTYPFDIYPASRIARFSSCPLLYEVHDLWPLSPIELGGYSRKHPFIMIAQHAEDFAYRKAAAVISMLPATLSYMQGRGLDASKWHYIPNGIVTSEWKSETPLNPIHASKLTELKKDFKYLIGYMGAHGVANALSSFTDAASKKGMEDIAFVLTGNGPEKPRLELWIEQRKIPNVFFLDPVPKTEIPALLSVFDILFISLQDQALFRFGVSPNKLFDYMMAGKPVIQAIRAGCDLVEAARCGLTIPPEDPQSIANAIQYLLELDPASRLEMGENGKRYVTAHHDYKILANQFIDIIKTLNGQD